MRFARGVSPSSKVQKSYQGFTISTDCISALVDLFLQMNLPESLIWKK